MASRTAVLAWGALVASAVLAVILWQQAFGTNVERRVTYGHARLRYESREGTANPRLAAAAVAVGVAGATIWMAWARRWSGRSRAFVLALGAVILAVAVPATYVRADRVGELTFPDTERYDSVETVASRMAEAGIPCTKMRPIERTDLRFIANSAECAIEAELAIDDGFDDATIGIWIDEDALEHWRQLTNSSDVTAVIGPTWLVVCEFESTCSEIQYKIGGRNF